MQTKLSLDTSVQYVKGVGPRLFKILNKINVYTIEDLFYYIPVRYENRSKFLSINKLKPGLVETIKGEIITTNLRRARRGIAIFQIIISDKTGTVSAIWFNQPYLKDYIKRGKTIILHGKLDRRSGILQFNSPEYEVVDDETDPLHMGKIVPIYKLTRGLGQKRLRRVIYNAINSVDFDSEYLPEETLKKHNLINLSKALKFIHFPKNENNFLESRKRLVFDDFFLLQVLIAIKKSRSYDVSCGITHKIDRQIFKKIINLLDFDLTSSQKDVINEIVHDMSKPAPMNRLLQGDVGSGKTVVSMFAVLLSLSNNYQTAFMVPTEILAIQHFNKFKYIFSKLGYKVEILISSLDKKKSEQVKSNIKENKINLVIGTHSLIQEKVDFYKLGLVIIDEQHRFGVLQRSKLHKKGDYPDVLIMTATPIPRTLTMTLYGDMDVSIIKKLPPGRKTPKTFWVSENKRKTVYRFIEDKIKQGRQCFIICPLIEESEKLDLESAVNKFIYLKNNIFKNYRVGLLHGKIKSEQRNKILKEFSENHINILVTTSIIEVGINFPNASVMMVENSERFGLSQLHQLRGRISRSSYQPYCILISETSKSEARLRLESFIDTTDGFKIAEADLKLRGPGEFTGVKQHGLTEFKVANLIRDQEILKLARNEAFRIIEKYPNLSDKKFLNIKQKINKKYTKKDLSLIGA